MLVMQDCSQNPLLQHYTQIAFYSHFVRWLIGPDKKNVNGEQFCIIFCSEIENYLTLFTCFMFGLLHLL